MGTVGCYWHAVCLQTPHQQTDKLDLNKHPDRICGGGGFGPVSWLGLFLVHSLLRDFAEFREK